MDTVVVNIDTCVGCGDCIDSCPTSALYLRHAYVNGIYSRSLAIVETENCIGCQMCVPTCLWGALSGADFVDAGPGGSSSGTYGIPANSYINIEEAVSPSNEDFDPDLPCNPVFNGKSYTDSADLMVDALIDNARKQFGLQDLVAVAAILAGANIIGTRAKFAGATEGTSIASKYISGLIPGTSPIRLPVLTGYPWLGSGLKFSYTKNIGRFVGRTIPFLGWGILAYDLYKILQGAYNDYTNAMSASGC